MKKLIPCLFFLVLFSLTGCKTAMKIKGKPEKQLKTLAANAPVVVFEENDSLPAKQQKTFLGKFKIKDGGTTVDCSYERVIEIAKVKARQIGGNALKITQHKLPSVHWSTCHRVSFEIWKLGNTVPFEQQLIWNADRQLTWNQFQGKPENKMPSFFCGKISAQFQDEKFLSGKGHISVLPVLHYDCSWVQPDYQTDYLLAYNQVKFDLLEVYARKMRKAFAEAHLETRKQWNSQAPKIYTSLGKGYKEEIENLDRQTYYGTYPMEVWRWSFLSKKRLKKLQEYSSGIIAGEN